MENNVATLLKEVNLHHKISNVYKGHRNCVLFHGVYIPDKKESVNREEPQDVPQDVPLDYAHHQEEWVMASSRQCCTSRRSCAQLKFSRVTLIV